MLKRHNVKIILCLLWVISTVALTRKLTHRGITNHNFKNSDFRVCCKMNSKVFLNKSQKYSTLSILMAGVFMQLGLLLIYAVRNRRMSQDMQRWGASRETRALKLIFSAVLKPGFHYTANATTTTQKQSNYKVEQSSFTLIALF